MGFSLTPYFLTLGLPCPILTFLHHIIPMDLLLPSLGSFRPICFPQDPLVFLWAYDPLFLPFRFNGFSLNLANFFLPILLGFFLLLGFSKMSINTTHTHTHTHTHSLSLSLFVYNFFTFYLLSLPLFCLSLSFIHSSSLRSSMAINKDSMPPTMIGKIRPYIVFMKPPSTSSQLPKAFSATIFRFIQEDRCPFASRMRFLINGPGEEWEGLTKNNLGLITYKVVPFCFLVPLPFLSFESSNFWKHLKKKRDLLSSSNKP